MEAKNKIHELNHAYTDEELAWLKAMDHYTSKVNKHPTACEVLAVAIGLGYRKQLNYVMLFQGPADGQEVSCPVGTEVLSIPRLGNGYAAYIRITNSDEFYYVKTELTSVGYLAE